VGERGGGLSGSVGVRGKPRSSVREWLEEIVWAALRKIGDEPEFGRRGLKGLEALLECRLQLERGGDVAASVAVVGRGPDRDKPLVEHPIIQL